MAKILFTPLMEGLAQIVKCGEVDYVLNFYWGTFHNATITGSMPILLDCETAWEVWSEQSVGPYDQLWWTRMEMKWKSRFIVRLTRQLFPETDDGYGEGHFGEIWNWT